MKTEYRNIFDDCSSHIVWSIVFGIKNSDVARCKEILADTADMYCNSHKSGMTHIVSYMGRLDNLNNDDWLMISRFISSEKDRYSLNYHMFGAGGASEVKLHCAAGTMDAIIDRFCYDVQTEPLESGEFVATVTVAVNSVFFGWVFGFDGLVSIQSPSGVRESYREMLKRAK